MNDKKKILIHPTKNDQGGFTLIEILVVIGIIAILASVVLVAVNPARQFAQARNSQRISNTVAILNAVGENIADNTGLFICASGPIPSTPTDIKSSGGYDIRSCLVSNYLPEIPVDPTTGTLTLPSDVYDTGYSISQDPTTNRITISAPSAELGQSISVTR